MEIGVPDRFDQDIPVRETKIIPCVQVHDGIFFPKQQLGICLIIAMPVLMMVQGVALILQQVLILQGRLPAKKDSLHG